MVAGNQEEQPAAAAMEQPMYGCSDTAVVPKRKVRMHPEDVRFTMSLKREELGGTEFLDRFAHKFTPEQIEEHRRLHEEVAAIFRKDNEEIEARQAQVARELSEKGYVEIDEADPAAEEAYDKWATAQWESMTNKPWFRRMKFADPGNEDGAAGWTVRLHDAEEDEDEYDDDDDDDDEEDEYDEDVDDEVEVDVDEDDTNARIGRLQLLNPIDNSCN